MSNKNKCKIYLTKYQYRFTVTFVKLALHTKSRSIVMKTRRINIGAAVAIMVAMSVALDDWAVGIALGIAAGLAMGAVNREGQDDREGGGEQDGQA
jgi:hypothetical protein